MEDLAAIDEGIDLIIVCDPASPGGWNIQDGVMQELLLRAAKTGAFVILDESFYHLSDAGETDRAARLIGSYENLIIIRSLTKTLAIPGIRIGYAIGSGQRISSLRERLPEWDLSIIGEAAVIAGMKVLCESDFPAVSLSVIQRERKYLADSLRATGLFVFESNAPYLLFKGPKNLYQKLLERGILIRDCRDYEGLGEGCFRVAVKMHKENEKLIQNIENCVNID